MILRKTFENFMHNFFKLGCIDVIYTAKKTVRFGEKTAKTPITVRIHTEKTERHLLFNPQLAVGEAYANGTLSIENGTLYDLLKLCAINQSRCDSYFVIRLLSFTNNMFRRLYQLNSKITSRKNVAHHYDLSVDFYKLFLDEDLQYSCAYFNKEGLSLEEAQLAKKHLLMRKLLLSPGMLVLDVGCGWGGLALTLAKEADVEVLGITISEKQLCYAKSRAMAAGLQNKVRFELLDYRSVSGIFDRIVSVGMFEHVGVPNYQTFFRRIRDLLTPKGIALIHSIGRAGPPGFTGQWLRKYIFPGGYCPSLSEVTAAVEPTDLLITDIEVLRIHYANTLAEWRRRFEKKRSTVLRLYDERFYRMWEFYLTMCEVTFRYQNMMVWQMQLAREISSVPLVRDYVYDNDEDIAQQTARTSHKKGLSSLLNA